MSAWVTQDMAEALPAQPTTHSVATGEIGASPVKKNPQEAGWVPKQGYDYETYNKSSKELIDHQLAGGEGWASNAAKYEWSDEYGEIGPAFPDLELQLFGGENRVRKGIQFSKYNHGNP